MWIRRSGLNLWRFRRAIALRRFIAVQNFRADSAVDMSRKVLIAGLVLVALNQ